MKARPARGPVRIYLRLLLVTTFLCVVPARAQSSAALDTPFQARIFANLRVADSIINIGNTGASGGNLCVNIYVFSPSEREVACCSCFLTPNAVITTTARRLVSLPITPAVPNSITVKLLATSGTGGATSCNAAAPGPTASGLIAFGITTHAATVGGSITQGTYALSETPFVPATLGAAELLRITTLCGFIQSDGSGFGQCPGCSTGAAGAVR